jgi:hypothetical protein
VEARKRDSLLATGPDTGGSRSFFAIFYFEFYDLAFFDSVKVQLLQRTAVEEDLLPIGGANKSESAVTYDAFDRALHKHLGLRNGVALEGLLTWPTLLPYLQAGALYQYVKGLSKGVLKGLGAKV